MGESDLKQNLKLQQALSWVAGSYLGGTKHLTSLSNEIPDFYNCYLQHGMFGWTLTNKQKMGKLGLGTWKTDDIIRRKNGPGCWT